MKSRFWLNDAATNLLGNINCYRVSHRKLFTLSKSVMFLSRGLENLKDLVPCFTKATEKFSWINNHHTIKQISVKLLEVSIWPLWPYYWYSYLTCRLLYVRLKYYLPYSTVHNLRIASMSGLNFAATKINLFLDSACDTVEQLKTDSICGDFFYPSPCTDQKLDR